MRAGADELDLVAIEPDDPFGRWLSRLRALGGPLGPGVRGAMIGFLVATVAAVGALAVTAVGDADRAALAPVPVVDPTTPVPTTVESPLVVHVTGAVVEPGVHEVAVGARVVDAVDAAGGAGPEADLQRLNLAAPLLDGAWLYVPRIGEEQVPVPLGVAEESSGPVRLNRADAAALESLPGVGPAIAAAILEHRERIGAFTQVDQLLDVPGIGPAKFEGLVDLVSVE